MNNIYCLDQEMIDLAHRALRCKHWTIHPPEASRQHPKRNQRGMLWVRERQPRGNWLPDFGDDSTRGCLLGLVRRAWRCDWLTCQPLMTETGEHGWRVIGPFWRAIGAVAVKVQYPVQPASTEAEALVAALGAAP